MSAERNILVLATLVMVSLAALSSMLLDGVYAADSQPTAQLRAQLTRELEIPPRVGDHGESRLRVFAAATKYFDSLITLKDDVVLDRLVTCLARPGCNEFGAVDASRRAAIVEAMLLCAIKAGDMSRMVTLFDAYPSESICDEPIEYVIVRETEGGIVSGIGCIINLRNTVVSGEARDVCEKIIRRGFLAMFPDCVDRPTYRLIIELKLLSLDDAASYKLSAIGEYRRSANDWNESESGVPATAVIAKK